MFEVSDYVSVFLDFTKSAQVRILKIKFLSLLLSYFWNINPNSHKRPKASALSPQSIFKSIEGRDIPKLRDFLFT